MITKLENAISNQQGQLIIKGKKIIWDIPKNIEAEEKWVLKKEELEKETNKNNCKKWKI